jgi:hypothetical protein
MEARGDLMPPDVRGVMFGLLAIILVCSAILAAIW